MCGRYVGLVSESEIEDVVREAEGKLNAIRGGDVCPSQSSIVVTGKKPYLTAEEMMWGFPQYQKKGLLINARSETVLERKMFRDSVLRRRCIIPARKFYEWDREKNRVLFSREDQSVMYFAGFYNCFQEQDRFVILTTEANGSVISVHPRMPLILEKEELENWIYDDRFTEFALHKVPVSLNRWQEYEQQSLFL